MPNTYEKVEREYLDRLDTDYSDNWRLAMAVLMVVAELRELRETLEQAALEARGR